MKNQVELSQGVLDVDIKIAVVQFHRSGGTGSQFSYPRTID